MEEAQKNKKKEETVVPPPPKKKETAQETRPFHLCGCPTIVANERGAGADNKRPIGALESFNRWPPSNRRRGNEYAASPKPAGELLAVFIGGTGGLSGPSDSS